MISRKLTGAGVAAAMLGILLLASSRASGAEAARRSGWAQAATFSCRHMQARMDHHRGNYWQPLADPMHDLARVAYLRRVLLKIHRDGLAEIESKATASRPIELRAVATYRQMLRTIAAVANAADSGDRKAFSAADVRMDLSILRTRQAFQRAGAAHICRIAI
jgi:hypothetical protein